MRTRLIVAAGWLALAGYGVAPASAEPVVDPLLPTDPPVPTDVPPVPPVPPAPQSMIGQAIGQVTQSNPVAAMADALANSQQVPVLGQAPLPPGTIASGPAPDPMALAQLLMPQNYRMPAEDQDSPYALAPNTSPSPFARIDAWKGVHAILHGSIGRMPSDELGQALPGTAPPPGSNLPPGLEQFYVLPAVPPATPALPAG